MNEPIHFTDEHRMFRDSLRRFIAEEVVPHAAAWEEEGFVPRAVLRRMGELGFLGVRYAPEYGGSGLDTIFSVPSSPSGAGSRNSTRRELTRLWSRNWVY